MKINSPKFEQKFQNPTVALLVILGLWKRPCYLDWHAWANSVDPDHTLQNQAFEQDSLFPFIQHF